MNKLPDSHTQPTKGVTGAIHKNGSHQMRRQSKSSKGKRKTVRANGSVDSSNMIKMINDQPSAENIISGHRKSVSSKGNRGANSAKK